MGTVHLALLWHFHQPCYQDLISRKLLMPWVRLHGLKDYTGMACLLEEFPQIRCDVNFSPVLLDQIRGYGRGESDIDLELARRPAHELSDSEQRLILKRFFSAHPETMIRAHPRYAELKHQAEVDPASLTNQDYLDLQVLANLAWFHPVLVESMPELRRLKDQGRHFTESDKEALLALEISVLAGILPRWKALQDRGQIEITTSPYYHPILPLMLDMNDARPGLPDRDLPATSPLLQRDAVIQVERAIEVYRNVFGRVPEGMWPSEGSVSTGTCRMASSQGIRWMATDEAILGRTLGTFFCRNGAGVLERPQALYVPYRLSDTTLVFRDHELSDLIGFAYKTWDPGDAAADFVRRLETVAKNASENLLACVICDGENPWEHYPGNGVPFLRRLYEKLSQSTLVRTTTVREYLAAHPPTQKLETLHPGSWIDANFGIWVGHEEDCRGWKYLIQARQDLEDTIASGEADPDRLERARECLYAAEGSDWFWWFGPEFSSGLDHEFDALFRQHLMNSYLVRGRTPPEFMTRPIKEAGKPAVYRPPWAALSVHLDGRRSDYFEWIGAGHYPIAAEVPTMVSEVSPLTDLYFGFDERSLLLRFDIKTGDDYNGRIKACTIFFQAVHPREQRQVLWGPGRAEPVRSVLGGIMEVAVPFDFLGYREGEEVRFYIDVEEPRRPRLRVPEGQPLTVTVPSADVTKIYWQV